MSDTTVRVIVIVVNFNQEHEIKPFLEELVRFWPIQDVVLVDDGSRDLSPQIAAEMGLEVLRHDTNLGVGAALRTGFLRARSRGYTHVVIMSSNGKMRPQDITTIVGPIMDGTAEYVTGTRFAKGGSAHRMPLGRKFAIHCLSIIGIFVFGRRFTDITCGYRCYPISLVFDPRVDISQSWLNRYEMEYYIHFYACKLRLRVVERPVVIRYGHLSTGRRSKIRPVVDWFSILRPFLLLGLRFRR